MHRVGVRDPAAVRAQLLDRLLARDRRPVDRLRRALHRSRSADPRRLCTTPWLASSNAITAASGTSTRTVTRVRSTQKLPIRQPGHLREMAHRRLARVVCQFVFDTKLAAVLNANADGTPPTSVGFSGSAPCTRSSRYSPTTDTALNAGNDNGYTFHGCSRAGSTPATR